MKEPFIVIPPEMIRVIVGFFILTTIAIISVASCDDYDREGSTAPIYAPQDTTNRDTTKILVP